LGPLLTLLVVLLAGILATNLIGKRLLAYGERLLLSLPLASSIYRPAKEITQTLTSDRRQVLRQVVMLEFPQPGHWVVGFLVGEAGSLFRRDGTELLKVFIPHVPLPTSDFLVLVPEDKIVPLKMSVEEGLRFLISTGIVEPAYRDRSFREA